MDSILKYITVWFRVHFILKTTEVRFLGNVFRHVLLPYFALCQFFVIELVLVRILGVHRSESAHQGMFLEVSESALMVLATTFVPFPLTGIGYVCYDSRWSPKKHSAKYYFR